MNVMAMIVGSVLTLYPSATLAHARFDEPAKAAPSAKGEKADLKPKYATGQSIKFVQKIERKDSTVFKMGEDAKSMELTLEQTIEYTLKVDGASDKGVVLSLELTHMKAKANVPAKGDFEWDSNTPPDDGDAKNLLILAFKPAIGTVTQFTLDAEGNISEVKPDPRLSRAVGGEMQPFVVSISGADHMRVRWGPILNIKDGAEPAETGSSWKNVETLNAPPLGGRFEFAQTNTLKGVSDALARIDIAGEVALVPLEKNKPTIGTLRDPKASGDATWDTKAGVVKSHTWNQVYTVDVNQGGMAFTRTFDSKTTTERKD